MTKGATDALTRSLAVEVGDQGIRVTSHPSRSDRIWGVMTYRKGTDSNPYVLQYRKRPGLAQSELGGESRLIWQAMHRVIIPVKYHRDFGRPNTIAAARLLAC